MSFLFDIHLFAWVIIIVVSGTGILLLEGLVYFTKCSNEQLNRDKKYWERQREIDNLINDLIKDEMQGQPTSNKR